MDCTIYVAINKGAALLSGNCEAFVFANAKIKFSHDMTRP